MYWSVLESTPTKGVIESPQRVVLREGINVLTDWAPSAYVLAVACVEAFLNEMFLSPATEDFINSEVLKTISAEWLEKVDIGPKLVIVPQLVSGRTFARNQQPYQDMQLLIKVRNAFVHYKMKFEIPSFLKPLQDLGIALKWEPMPWASALSTSEGIRWAHNTACCTMRELLGFLPDTFHPMKFMWENYLSEISTDNVRAWFVEHGKDPDH